MLTGGQLVEVTRADLVGKYVGHTAPLTQQVIRSAIGGVLFIDEAYALYRGADDSFGLEAIDTIVKGMEDNRQNLIVILAGYSREMEEFLTANSGLNRASRTSSSSRTTRRRSCCASRASQSRTRATCSTLPAMRRLRRILRRVRPRTRARPATAHGAQPRRGRDPQPVAPPHGRRRLRPDAAESRNAAAGGF